MEIAYFKRHQRNNIYHYYKVYGGPGRTENGYQEIINFLNETPIITIEHNDLKDLTGTWCTYEVGIPITENEYIDAFKKATQKSFKIL